MNDIRAQAAAIFAGLTFRLVLLGIIAALVVNTYADFGIKGPLGIGFHFEGWKPKAQRLAVEKKGCEGRLGASNDSIGRLQKVIEDRNAEIRLRADEFTAAKRVADERGAELERLAVASDARIARLREIAAAPSTPGQCETPAELRELAEGL